VHAEALQPQRTQRSQRKPQDLIRGSEVPWLMVPCKFAK
jgi:hypothetical protein